MKAKKRSATTLTNDQCLQLADAAVWRKEEIVERLANVSEQDRRALAHQAQMLSQRSVEHRSMLRHLIHAIDAVPVVEAKLRKAREEERSRVEAWQQGRKALATLATSHPRGELIGATQTVQYKSPGAKKHWGTKRKRRK